MLDSAGRERDIMLVRILEKLNCYSRRWQFINLMCHNHQAAKEGNMCEDIIGTQPFSHPA
jgi:hypothetical protein